MFRKLSWATLMVALVVPPIWASQELSAFGKAHPENLCGLPMLAIYAIAILGTGILSLIASSFAWVALRRLVSPRPFGRKLEFAAITCPAIVCIAGIAAFLVLT